MSVSARETTMNETKACPYCGEQVLAVAIKCKHCGSNLAGPAGPPVSQYKIRPVFVVLLGIALAVFGAGFVANWNRTGTLSGKGFTEADVANIEQNISIEFSKRPGVRVEQVKMLRESPTQMTGFVKLKMPLLGDLQKSCNAKLVEGEQTFWRCD